MNTLRISATAAISALSILASAQNPICPTGVLVPDPSARVVDGKIYIYGSLDKYPDRYCSDEYYVLSSADACKWEVHRNAFKWETILYAPDMAQKGNKFYLYYEIPDGSEFVAEADSPVGPFKNGVKIEGPKQIDPCVFIDDDGQGYYFWGQFSAKGAKLNPDMKTIDQSSIRDSVLTEKDHGFHEGVFLMKRGKYYYLIYADISRNKRPTCIGYSMSESPFGPYEYKGVIVDNAGCDPEVWNNHGSVVQLGEQWYVLYHRSTNGGVFMRRACIEPIFFNEDGTINEVEMTSQGAGKPLNAFADIEAERACKLSGNARIKMIEGCNDNEEIADIRDGDTAVWKYLDFGKGAKKVTLQMSAPSGCTVEVLAGEELIATVNVPSAEGWQSVSSPVKRTKGVQALKLRFSCKAECNIDKLVFCRK